MQDFGLVNEVYAQAMGEHRPARECMAVAEIPLGAKVEISVIAQKA